jgi:hypothetical protein
MPSGIEPSTQLIVNAVWSLCIDQLRPYGRILKKRITELVEASGEFAPDVTLGRLRVLCEQCDSLRVVAEGDVDWSAEPAAGAPAGFVDIYSTHDDYEERLWSEFAEWLGSCGEEISAVGGRYVYALALMSCNLPFLVGYSLGYVSHIVQLAMTQRRLLGYRNGAIVPYIASRTMMKQHCADNRQSCRKTKLSVATWDVLRTCLRELLDIHCLGNVGGIPLSNVKRSLRSTYKVDLSETVLGHATTSDVFKDERLQDICTLRLHEKGYVLVPTPWVAPGLPKEEASFTAGSLAVPSSFSPPTLLDQSIQILSTSAFSTASVQLFPLNCGGRQSEDSWNLTCAALGISDTHGSNSDVAGGVAGLFDSSAFEFRNSQLDLTLSKEEVRKERDAQDNQRDDVHVTLAPSPSAIMRGHGLYGMLPQQPLVPTHSGHAQGVPFVPQAAHARDDCQSFERELCFTGCSDTSSMLPPPGFEAACDGWHQAVATPCLFCSRGDDISNNFMESTSGDGSSDTGSLPVAPRESQIFASTPSPYLGGGGFAMRLREETQSFAAGTMEPALSECEGANRLPLQFIEDGGFALQPKVVASPSSQGGAVAGDNISDSRFEAKVVNTFITFVPRDIPTRASSGRSRARSEEPRQAVGRWQTR